jgi:NAD+ kinase
MLKICLLFKSELTQLEHIFNELEYFRNTKKCKFYILNTENNEIYDKYYLKPPSYKDKIDLIICFGGDGTMISSTFYAYSFDAPVLGVNLGRLGFLTDVSIKELRKSITDMINKKYDLESRMMINICVVRGKKTIFEGTALNDSVLFKGSEAKLITLKLYANNDFVYEARCDGIVVATPTGSTAYSLAAGGPIISQSMNAIIVNPLNPHILSIRPMVFADTDIIEIKNQNEHHIRLQIDGIDKYELIKNDKIIIKKSLSTIKFVKLKKKTFYSILRQKLHMGKN